MRLDQMREVFPNATFVIRRICDAERLTYGCFEDFSVESLPCVDGGVVPESDVRMLLLARAAAYARQQRT